MDRNFRKKTIAYLLKNAGVVSDLVEKTLNITSPSSFKEAFLKTPPGKAREELIYNELTKRGPPKQLVPVTVDGPGGTKITYRVMPDYVMIDGIRVTMAPATAQRVADFLKMKLPTDKMSKQIYQAADTKVRAVPLSSGGYIGADGKHYSAKDVVENRIGKSDAALEYSRMTDVEIAKLQQQRGQVPTLISGHGKEIIQPLGNPKDVSFGGWQGQDGKEAQPYETAHPEGAGIHSEYAMYSRLMDENATITTPDGRTIATTVDDLQNDPVFSKFVATIPGVKRYHT